MESPDKRLKKLCQVFRVPPFLTPWIDRFFDSREIDLILILSDGPMSPEEIAGRLGRDYDPPTVEDFLKRAHSRGIVNALEDGRFEIADFHARFEIWALFEGWQDIPETIREQLNIWEFSHYEEIHRDQVRALKDQQAGDATGRRPEYLLVQEAEAIIDRMDHIYLWPCNCRAMMRQCSLPVYVCLRFSNDRDIGWEISKTRAKEITREANKKGLMQSGELSLMPDGSIQGAICNCCSDCCYPHLLAKHEGAEKLWPLSRYVAGHSGEKCSSCGLCVKRCPFRAFETMETRDEGSGKKKKAVIYREALCRGCGVCATACPEGAIEMIRRDGPSRKLSRADRVLHPED